MCFPSGIIMIKQSWVKAMMVMKEGGRFYTEGQERGFELDLCKMKTMHGDLSR